LFLAKFAILVPDDGVVADAALHKVIQYKCATQRLLNKAMLLTTKKKTDNLKAR
jgi:hypothetical protein